MHDTAAPQAVDGDAQADLTLGDAYRIVYVSGGGGVRRLARSVAYFDGLRELPLWDGHRAMCLNFTLPNGRRVSLCPEQLVEARAASRNERGKWILAGSAKRRLKRREVVTADA